LEIGGKKNRLVLRRGREFVLFCFGDEVLARVGKKNYLRVEKKKKKVPLSFILPFVFWKKIRDEQI